MTTSASQRCRLGAIVLLWIVLPAGLPAQTDRGIRLDGDVVIRVGPSGADTAEARAAQIEARLAALLERAGPVEPTVRRGTDRTSRVITIDGVDVLTVTPEDAAVHAEDVDRLAAEWSEELRLAVQRGRDRRRSAPQRFVTQVRGNVRSALSRLVEDIAETLPRTLAALLVLGLVWIAATLVWRVNRASLPRLVHDVTLRNLVVAVLYYAVWVIGLLVALDAMGFNPQTFVTGIGLTGVALGFALKDIVSNLVSGLLIQAMRPFEIGDEIVVGSTEGRVDAIDLRATHIRAYDGRLVLVPNGEVFTSRVTNNTAAPLRRGSVEMYVGYREDFSKILPLVRDTAQHTPGVAPDPPAYAQIRELNPSNILVEVRFWTDSRRADFMATSCNVRVAVLLALGGAGVGLPDGTVGVAPRDIDAWRRALATSDADARVDQPA
jgi:small-conductance mechanosensitive channel